jgi:hypothetical protein
VIGFSRKLQLNTVMVPILRDGRLAQLERRRSRLSDTRRSIRAMLLDTSADNLGFNLMLRRRNLTNLRSEAGQFNANREARLILVMGVSARVQGAASNTIESGAY